MMMNSVKRKMMFIVITFNLITGNAILLIGGKISFDGNVNYFLMTGMSLACIIVYFLFFNYSNFEKYSHLKLILLSVLSCIVIVFLGNLIALLIYEPKEALSNLPATLFMGILGNIIMFPISVILGLLNFGIMTYIKKK